MSKVTFGFPVKTDGVSTTQLKMIIDKTGYSDSVRIGTVHGYVFVRVTRTITSDSFGGVYPVMTMGENYVLDQLRSLVTSNGYTVGNIDRIVYD